MSIGNRIKYFRKLRGLTQQELGLMLGFSEKTAYVRIAQYEAHTHIPKQSLIKEMAKCLNVSPQALNVPGNRQQNRDHAHFVFVGRYVVAENRQN